MLLIIIIIIIIITATDADNIEEYFIGNITVLLTCLHYLIYVGRNVVGLSPGTDFLEARDGRRTQNIMWSQRGNKNKIRNKFDLKDKAKGYKMF
jgi:hypothetical protein